MNKETDLALMYALNDRKVHDLALRLVESSYAANRAVISMLVDLHGVQLRASLHQYVKRHDANLARNYHKVDLDELAQGLNDHFAGVGVVEPPAEPSGVDKAFEAIQQMNKRWKNSRFGDSIVSAYVAYNNPEIVNCDLMSDLFVEMSKKGVWEYGDFGRQDMLDALMKTYNSVEYRTAKPAPSAGGLPSSDGNSEEQYNGTAWVKVAAEPEQQEEEKMPNYKEYPLFEMRAYSEGMCVSDMRDEQIYASIEVAEMELKRLKNIKHKPKSLKNQITEIERQLNQLVDYVDDNLNK